MTPEDAFLEDIREHPDDDAPRLIFADWLEDNGDTDRAEFIRARVRGARIKEQGSPEAVALIERASELLQANWHRWLEPLSWFLSQATYRFNWVTYGYRPGAVRRFPRGFVEAVEMEARRFIEVAAELFRCYPIRHVKLHEAGGHGDRLAECRELAWVAELEFSDPYRAPLDARGMAHLARSPHLLRLARLDLYGNHLGDEGAEALAEAAWLSGVRSLSLGDNGLSTRGVLALARSERTFRPVHLRMDRNALGNVGTVALADSPILQSVRRLGLRDCGIGLPGVSALARSSHLRALEEIDLSNNPLTAEGVALVKQAPWAKRATV